MDSSAQHTEGNKGMGTAQAEEKVRAARRRQVLTEAGCRTYVIRRRDGALWIICLCCSFGSTNSHDIAQRYCGFCHAWHTEDA